MKTLTCTFAGHADVYSASVDRALSEAISSFIDESDETVFYVGGRGEFDKMAASAVRVHMALFKRRRCGAQLPRSGGVAD